MELEVISIEPDGEAKSTPLLFVHGAWHGAWCWEKHFMPVFAGRGYASHAVSLRGHGGSEGRRRIRWHRIRDYVEDVARVAGQLPSPPVVIGHSMGGLVVQKYLENHEAPAAVLLASVPIRGVWAATFRTARRIPLQFLKTNLLLRMYAIIETHALARAAFFSASLPEGELADIFLKLQNESYLAYLDMFHYLPRPKRVSAPLRVLGAREDAIFSPAEIEGTARAYGTSARIFPDMAHDMMLEPGWQDVAEDVLAFLDAEVA